MNEGINVGNKIINFAYLGNTQIYPYYNSVPGGSILYVSGGVSWELRVSTDYGVTSTLVNNLPSGNYSNVVTDSTGKYLLLLSDTNIYQSSDYGVSVTPIITNGINVASINITNDGIKRLINNNTALYLSTDTGNTYNVISTSGITFPIGSSMSRGDGSVIVLSNATKIYVSTNSGSTFTARYTYRTNENGRQICISDSGQYISIMTYINYKIYCVRSTDYGATFNIITLPELPSYLSSYSLWIGMTMSQNGKYQYAAIVDSGLSYSTDYGATWNIMSTPTNGTINVWSSGNNQYLYLQKYGGPFEYEDLISLDGGLNWQGIGIYGGQTAYVAPNPYLF